MRRLVENEGLLDGLDVRLVELFRTANHNRVDPFRKRRIWVRLERTPVRDARRFLLRPVVAAALLVSGSAAAALGQRYVAHGFGILDLASARKSRVASVLPTTPRPTAARLVTPNLVEATAP